MGWHMDRGMRGIIITFITVTRGTILDITLGISLGNMCSVRSTCNMGDMRVVSMHSMEVVGDSSDFWVAHDLAKVASAAFCFHQNKFPHFDYLRVSWIKTGLKLCILQTNQGFWKISVRPSRYQ